MPATNRIEIRAADPSWPSAFAMAADQLAADLCPDARIEHIGSTAVPGLAAKPVIDILIGVPRADEVSNAVRSLVRLGFTPGATATPETPSTFFSRRPRGEGLAVNVHLTVTGSSDWHSLTRFRIALQGDPTLAKRYEALKRRLAAASGGDLNAYTAGKAAFIAHVLQADHG